MLQLIEALRNGQKRKIDVIGDVIFDVFSYCERERDSSEALGRTVDIHVEDNQSLAPGGSGNVALNIARLGGVPRLISVIGNDHQGADLTALLKEHGIVTDELVIDAGRPTNMKTRICDLAGEMIICHHKEQKHPIESWIVKKAIASIGEEAAIVIISDYHRGMITEDLVRRVIASGKMVLADIRPRDQFHETFDPLCYKGAYLLKPNRNEARILTGSDTPLNSDAAVAEAGTDMALRYDANILITRDGEGMSLITKEGKVHHYPVVPNGKVRCVSGAGDTVISVVAICLAADITLPDAVRLASYAASIVVGKDGTSSLTMDELESKIKSSPVPDLRIIREDDTTTESA